MASEEERVPTAPEEAPEEQIGVSAPTKIRWVRRAMREAVPGTGKSGEFVSYNLRAFETKLSEQFVAGHTFEVGAHGEHEKTRELIIEKLTSLAQKKDVVHAKEEIIQSLTEQIRDLRERLQTATAELAKSRELEAATTRLCEKVRCESELTRERMSGDLAELRQYLSKFAPHRRFFKVTFGFFFFFAASLLLATCLGIDIVEPFWASVGVGVTLAILVVVYFGMKDTEKPSVSCTTNSQ